MNDQMIFEMSRKKFFCDMKTRFYLHDYVSADGESQIIFSVTIMKKRKRVYTGYFCEPQNWDRIKQRTTNDPQMNLILDNILSKATKIKTFYFLTNKPMSLDSFLNEYFSQTPSFDFNSFMLREIEKLCSNKNTKKKHMSIHKKLQTYRENLPFTDITFEFLNNYRSHLRNIGNNKTTENSNIKIIKGYLKLAQRYGILLNIDLDLLQPGSCSGNRTAISIEDIRKLQSFLFSSFIRPNWKLTLGYFLFAYNTGMRISDLRNLRRNNLTDYLSFKTVKTNKMQEMKLNNNTKAILNNDPRLFNEIITQQKMNLQLKEIGKFLGIRKKLTLHVARHTFATNYLKAGGTVHNLQILLGHSSLETTMVYVHLDTSDALETVHLLDSL